jgi:cobaltochelatase CobT
VIGPPAHALENAAHYRSEYHEAKRILGSKLATMRRKLERALVAKVACDYETGISGRLNVRSKAAGIIMGADKIYKRRVDGEDIDTAVTLLVDCSGSMSGDAMKLAGHSAIALAEALEAGSVPYEVIGHTTTSLSNESDRRLRDAKRIESEDGESVTHYGWARECAMHMPVFKPFDKALRQCYHTMGFLPTSADNANADACALREAGSRLLKRQEAKKVLMLLADGYPAWSTSLTTADRNAYTRQAVVNLEEQGVDCVGIGIASDCVKQFFGKWVVINSIDDLSKTVLDQIAKMIIGERFTVDNADLIGGKGATRTSAS